VALVTGSAALIAALALPFLMLPASQSWPYIAASALIHIFYFLLIGAAYRSGDMSHAYPLMRGTAPLLIALASAPLVGEQLAPGEWGGVLLICGGIFGMLLARSVTGHSHGRSSRFALMNAVVIAAYTVLDGVGVRISGQPVSYTLWMFMLQAIPIVAWTATYKRIELVAGFRTRWPHALIGGACSMGAYALILLAMEHAPIALVAALRETAILFGLAISALFLKERLGVRRLVPAVVILLGVAMLKLSST
jgi:drug/metabolite transporter (DMT)-like permease